MSSPENCARLVASAADPTDAIVTATTRACTAQSIDGPLQANTFAAAAAFCDHSAVARNQCAPLLAAAGRVVSDSKADIAAQQDALGFVRAMAPEHALVAKSGVVEKLAEIINSDDAGTNIHICTHVQKDNSLTANVVVVLLKPAAQAVRAIAEAHREGAQHVAEVGGLDLIAKMLHSPDTDLICTGAVCMRAAATVAETRDEAHERELVARLLTLLSHPNDDVKVRALRALARLAATPSIAQYIAAAPGAMEYALATLQAQQRHLSALQQQQSVDALNADALAGDMSHKLAMDAAALLAYMARSAGNIAVHLASNPALAPVVTSLTALLPRPYHGPLLYLLEHTSRSGEQAAVDAHKQATSGATLQSEAAVKVGKKLAIAAQADPAIVSALAQGGPRAKYSVCLSDVSLCLTHLIFCTRRLPWLWPSAAIRPRARVLPPPQMH